MKNHLIQGLIAGILASLASVVYLTIYQELYFLDFSSVIDAVAISTSSIVGCLLMSIGYILLDKINKRNFRGVLNILIMVLTFLSILPAMTMTLPLDVSFPELFPGLVIPMHFFPAMIFFGLSPFFKR